jgi:nucleoside-diphosphate-sugar epimerase
MRGRVAVTGANGFIGQHIVRHFSDAGWEVRAILRPGRQCTVPPGVELVAAPLAAADLMRAAADIDGIVHAAGRTRAAMARQFATGNVEGTR